MSDKRKVTMDNLRDFAVVANGWLAELSDRIDNIADADEETIDALLDARHIVPIEADRGAQLFDMAGKPIYGVQRCYEDAGNTYDCVNICQVGYIGLEPRDYISGAHLVEADGTPVPSDKYMLEFFGDGGSGDDYRALFKLSIYEDFSYSTSSKSLKLMFHIMTQK